MEFHHVSILLQPCLDALNIKPDGIYVDATTGGAGHSLHIAQELGEGGRLICIDRDDEALENAKTRLASVWDRVTTVKSDFRDIDRVLEGQGLSGADATKNSVRSFLKHLEKQVPSHRPSESRQVSNTAKSKIEKPRALSTACLVQRLAVPRASSA